MMAAARQKKKSMLAAEVEEGKLMLAAEAEAAEERSLLAAEAEAKEESLRAAEAEAQAERRMCRFRHCLCEWKGFSPTSRVAPGIDYVCTPFPDADAAGDHHLPAWSLLVGVTDPGASSLQVSRLRVARSGRILGRSDDLLEVCRNIVLAKQPGYSFEAAVAPMPSDGLSLCLLHNNILEHPQALQLSLHSRQAKDLPLPEIRGTTTHCIPISAYGHMWALSANRRKDDIKLFNVLMRRLVPKPGGGMRWKIVGDGPFSSLLKHSQGRSPPWKGAFLQGYAVIPDANLILVSFQQYGLFLTFAPHSSTWTEVLTDTIDKRRSQHYLPIFGRGIYVEQHKAVYILQDNTVYAYKLTYQKDDQGKKQLRLDLPVKIDYVCPFIPDKGYGFLTHLTDSLMCSVWISLAWRDPCPCENLHAIVTTFVLHDPSPGGIKVLHSTYRRVHMAPDPPAYQMFCFLQEYEDHDSPVLQQRREEQEDLTSSQRVDEPSKRLTCCRNMEEMRSIRYIRFQCGMDFGHIAHKCSFLPVEGTIPPFGLCRSLPVDPASSEHKVCSSSPDVPVKPDTTTIKKDLFIVCQSGSRSVIYQTGAIDADVKPLEPYYVADGIDHYWHFFQSGSKVHAVSSMRGGMLEFSLNKAWLPVERPVRRPTAGPFVMVIRVGQETIALTETLQVYHQTQFNYGSTTWLRYTTDESDIFRRRVEISGYVAVNDDSLIVCDAVTCSCLLFDLGARQWRVVMPWAAFKEDRPTTIPKNGYLNGRCVYVDGFIYTCLNGGLAAYELLGEDHSVYLSKPILLPLSWRVHCVDEDMCLDYAGKDVESGDNLFHVVEGGYFPPRHGVRITTVKVKTKRTSSNKMKPEGIDHVATATRIIHHTEAIKTRCCFAVSN